MRLLLDTHAFIWAVSAPGKLPAKVRAVVGDSGNDVFVSAVSFWEIAIKIRIRKLRPLGKLTDSLPDIAERTDIQTIHLTANEAASYGELTEGTHEDPFDRMLAWQAISRKLKLVTGDAAYRKFADDGLELLWK